VLLGSLLKVPQRVIDLSGFRHVPDVATLSSQGLSTRPASIAALALLAGIGALAAILGGISVNRRDSQA
jgi:hypothetical protein